VPDDELAVENAQVGLEICLGTSETPEAGEGPEEVAPEEGEVTPEAEEVLPEQEATQAP
jgi:hypothetical protein